MKQIEIDGFTVKAERSEADGLLRLQIIPPSGHAIMSALNHATAVHYSDDGSGLVLVVTIDPQVMAQETGEALAMSR